MVKIPACPDNEFPDTINVSLEIQDAWGTCVPTFNFGAAWNASQGRWEGTPTSQNSQYVAWLKPGAAWNNGFQDGFFVSARWEVHKATDCDSGETEEHWEPCDGSLPVQIGGDVEAGCCAGAPGATSEVIFVLSAFAGGSGTPPRLPEPGEHCPPAELACDEGVCGSEGCKPPTGCPGYFSDRPVRFATGEIGYVTSDLASDGFGLPWGHTRTFSNRQSAVVGNGNGFCWLVKEWPYLSFLPDGEIGVIQGTFGLTWFTKSGSLYIGDFGTKRSLVYNQGLDQYEFTDIDGTTTYFDGVTGIFRKRIAPGGASIEVTAIASNGIWFENVERSATVGGDTITEQYHYEYGGSNVNPRVTSVTLRRKVNSGSWSNVTRVVFTYYSSSDQHGDEGDLRTAQTQSWDGSAWATTGTKYYRYYRWTPPAGSSSSSSSSSGPETVDPRGHMLKFILGAAAFERLDAAVADPYAASDATVAMYADYYFDYDDDRRVTTETVQGGAATYEFAYSQSTNADGYNSWKYKTAETRPDGSVRTVFANYAGQPMLDVLESGSDQWITFNKYENARIVLTASPSAVTGYDETKADLLNYNSGTGKYQYLRDSDGLIVAMSWDSASGKIAMQGVRKGQTGALVKIREWEYVRCGGSSSSSSSSSSSGGGDEGVWHVSQETVYPSDTNQSLTNITSYAYTFHTGGCAVAQRTTTLPVVSTGQNGSGVAATRKDYFDTLGNRTWIMDERGFITRLEYDDITGVLSRRVDDVDTSVESGAPSGWSTPTGGGLNLVTDVESDDRGRITQVLGPSHSIDIGGSATTIRRATWMVYDDDGVLDVTRTGAGYATGSSPSYTYTLINPVSIAITDKNGNIQERIEATRASTSGKLLPTDTFAQSSYTRWTTSQYSDCCQLASRRVYHTIPTSGSGSSGTNYDQTDFGYDTMLRRIRSVTPGGTIARQVLDVRGLVDSEWVGTDDTGATPSDPTGGGASGNNMVEVTGNQYDGGSDGGDGLLTQRTQYAAASDTRVTQLSNDFRGRVAAIDGEVDYYEQRTYDNLDRVTRVDRRNTTSGGNLISRQDTKYDDRGRVYQSIRYGVDPSTGTVGNSLTDNTWYDDAGNVIKSQPAGAQTFTKSVFDSLGRQTNRYIGYDLDETSYADAGSVSDDTIFEQSETEFDDGGNAIEQSHAMRYNNATGTGPLNGPSGSQPKARIVYSAVWPDALGRAQATANYGTNGGSALSRPSTIPSRSDNVLVTSQEYDDAGNLAETTNPGGVTSCMEYDDAGRETSRTQNCVAGSSSSSSSSAGQFPGPLDTNVSVRTQYNPDGNVSKLIASNSLTGDQTTEYVHGTTLSDSDIASSLLKRKEILPDSTGSSDVVLFGYNRQGQVKTSTDQAGTVHNFDFDKLGRPTQDRVPTLGSGVDGAVRRIATAYEVRGMRSSITSHDNATVGSGSVLDQSQFEYNDFGQLATEYQEHSGAVNTSTSPKVQYGHADGSDNTIRPTTLTYPDGRGLTYDYGSSGGEGDALSRIESIVDDDSTQLVDYTYLGLSTFVEADYTEPDIKYTLIGTAGGNDPDTGDIYLGLDRFGRVKDSYWRDYGSSTDADRIKYGYDRNGGRIWRQNTVASGLGEHFDELYDNDQIDRLLSLDRGDLGAGKDSISNLQFAEQWGLDETGNWRGFRQDDDGSGWDLDQRRTANVVNEITDITETTGPSWATPAYSAAGNMTSIPKPSDPTGLYTATYDAWNRLVKVASGATTVAEYRFDGARRRIVVSSYTAGSLAEVRHAYFTEPSSWQVLEERASLPPTSPVLNRQFVWGLRYIDDCVLRDRDTDGNGTLDERLYALQDANWNVTSLADTAGDIQERYAYSAYGAPMFLTPSFTPRSSSSYAWERLFAGYVWDADVEWYMVRNRVYVVGLGWVQRDPLGYVDGVNLGEYCKGVPIRAVDPLGLIWLVRPILRPVLRPGIRPIPGSPSRPFPFIFDMDQSYDDPAPDPDPMPEDLPDPEPGPGDRIDQGKCPFGDCSEAKHRRFQAQVKRHCHPTRSRKCTYWMTCEQILENIRLANNCLYWRLRKDQTCWRGGDIDHRKKQNEEIDKLAICWWRYRGHRFHGSCMGGSPYLYPRVPIA